MPNSRLIKSSSYSLIFLCLAQFVAGHFAFAKQQCRIENQDFTLQQQVLWQDLVQLSSAEMQGRKSGTEGAQMAREFIVKRYRESGLAPLEQLQSEELGTSPENWFQHFTPPGLFNRKDGANVVGVIKGRVYPDKYIVVSAHYDHLGKKGRKVHFGANDNASGVAALFYLAHHLSQSGTQHSVVFLATDYEEAGLYGAATFVEQRLLKHSDILLNINLDMLGQPGRDWTLYVAGTRWFPHFKPVVEQVTTKAPVCAETGMDRVSRSYDRSYRIDWRKASDHWEFAQKDIPWLFLGVKDFKYYHTTQDTPDNLSRPFYIGVVDTALMMVEAMDHYLTAPK